MSDKRDRPLMNSPEVKAKSVKRIFELECKHIAEFNKGEISYQEQQDGKKDFRWSDCTECICAFIPFRVPYGDHGYIFRDVCFANWHDYIIAMDFAEYEKEFVSISVTTKKGKKNKINITQRPNPIIERIKRVQL